jgi:single-strand DNA-binding protein
MNALKNRVQLIGNLGADPEIKSFDNDRKMARISIATNEVYTNNKGERVEETQWHTVIAWGKLAEIAEKYLHKGSEVALEGKLVNRSWETKEGEKRYVTEVVAAELVMLGKKQPAAA